MKETELLKEAIASLRMAIVVCMTAIVLMFVVWIVFSTFVFPQVVEDRLTSVLSAYEVTIE